MLLVRFFAGWVATLVVAALTAAAFTAQGIYAPNRNLDKQRYTTASYLTSTAYSLAQATNNTALIAEIEGMPNFNRSSPNWKPQLSLTDAISIQQDALQYANVPVCGETPIFDPNATACTF